MRAREVNGVDCFQQVVSYRPLTPAPLPKGEGSVGSAKGSSVNVGEWVS